MSLDLFQGGPPCLCDRVISLANEPHYYRIQKIGGDSEEKADDDSRFPPLNLRIEPRHCLLRCLIQKRTHQDLDGEPDDYKQQFSN